MNKSEAQETIVIARNDAISAISVDKSEAQETIVTTKNDAIGAINVNKSEAQETIVTTKNDAIDAINVNKSEAQETIVTAKKDAISAISVDKSEAQETIVTAKNDATDAISVDKSEAQETIVTAKKDATDAISVDKSEAQEIIETAKNDTIHAISEKESKIEARFVEVTSDLNDQYNEFNETAKKQIETFTKLKKEFSELASKGFNSKSGDILTQAYEKNADSNQKKEIWFQVICGCSILLAVGVLIVWIFTLGEGDKITERWIPVATITSLFLFIARWAARIAYRSGLESRRLRQYALDLSTMPAFFSQTLLTQEEGSNSSGMQIIERKADKLFGNIERFDEQDSHGPMSLLWKWLTKKFEAEITPKMESENIIADKPTPMPIPMPIPKTKTKTKNSTEEEGG